MEETISLKEIFSIIKERFWLIFSLIFGAGLIAAIVTFTLITPTYEAKSQFIVNQSKEDPNAQYSLNDIRFNVELINTYQDVIKSPVILEDVIEQLNLTNSISSLQDQIQLSSTDSSQVVTITITNTDQHQAALIANTIVEIFQEKVPDLMNVDNVKVLSEAIALEDPTPVAPKPLLNIAIAIVLGGMVGVGLAFLLEYLDTTITDEEDVEEHLSLPVLGVISSIEEKDVRTRARPRSINRPRGRRGINDTTEKKTS